MTRQLALFPDVPVDPEDTGWLYILTDGEIFKIGFTKDWLQRLRDLQTGNGRPLQIVTIKQHEQAAYWEKRIHKWGRLSQYRQQGGREWYDVKGFLAEQAPLMMGCDFEYVAFWELELLGWLADSLAGVNLDEPSTERPDDAYENLNWGYTTPPPGSVFLASTTNHRTGVSEPLLARAPDGMYWEHHESDVEGHIGWWPTGTQCKAVDVT